MKKLKTGKGSNPFARSKKSPAKTHEKPLFIEVFPSYRRKLWRARIAKTTPNGSKIVAKASYEK